VPLVEFVVDALRRYLARQAERRLAAGTRWHDNDLVFDRGDGRLWNPSTLRHGCATLLWAAGVDPLVIANILGHTDARFTERIYTDLWFDVRRAGAEKMAAMLEAAASVT
jgi:integrase